LHGDAHDSVLLQDAAGDYVAGSAVAIMLTGAGIDLMQLGQVHTMDEDY
jgi:hypothetical protein